MWTALLMAGGMAPTSLVLWHLPQNAMVLRAQPPTMAGFGAPSGPKKGKAKGKAAAAKPEGLNAKRQWEIFRELRDRSDQVVTTSIYARLPSEKWLSVGGVIVEAPGTRIQAVAKHKKLILEHAARLHLKLAMRPRDIEVGFSDTSVESLSADDARIEPLSKCSIPADLVAGFQGLPDQKSGMYILGTQIRAAK